MSEQLKAATIRAFYGAIISAALTFIVTLQTTDWGNPHRYEIAGLACGAAFFTYMLARGVAEGIIDSTRAANGNVTPADVGQPQPR